MRRRVHTNTLGQVDPAKLKTLSISTKLTKPMTYDRSERNANFYLDLLADKLDVLQRKAENYMRAGEKEAAGLMQSSWDAVHSMYNALRDQKLSRRVSTTFMTTDGRAIGGDSILNNIQRAMDLADMNMKKAADLSRSLRRSEINGLNNRLRNLDNMLRAATKRAQACDQKLRNLTASNNALLEGKQADIQDLQSSLESAQASIISLQSEKSQCEAQIANLQSELSELQEPLVLQTSAFTSGEGSSAPLTIDFTDKSAIVKAITDRDTLIRNLTQNVDTAAQGVEKIREANAANDLRVKEAQDQATQAANDAEKYKKISIAAILIALAGGGTAYYMSRK